jgi:hypothetical protein
MFGKPRQIETECALYEAAVKILMRLKSFSQYNYCLERRDANLAIDDKAKPFNPP